MPKPVVFIPGLPGSNLLDNSTGERIFLKVPGSFKSPLVQRLEGPDVLTDDDGVVAGAPVARIKVGGVLGKILSLFIDLKQARSLYDILRPLYPAGEFTQWTERFGWDWRRPVWDPITQQALVDRILDLNQRRGKVVVIAHSTGGLVLRYLLEDTSNPQREDVLDSIDRVIAFGVPWAGTLKSFETLTGQRGLQTMLSPEKAREVLGRSWAAFDLLPPEPGSQAPQYPALAVRIANGVREHISPLAGTDRDWFPGGSEFAPLRMAMNKRADGTLSELGSRGPSVDLAGRDIEITNVVGWGHETALLAELTMTGSQTSVDFIYKTADAGLEPEDDGDNTIPRRSAAWLEGSEVRTFHIPIGRGKHGVQKHITLWSNSGGRNLLRHHVGGEPLSPFAYATVDKSDAVSGGPIVRLRCAANKTDGTALDEAVLRFLDPVLPDRAFDPQLDGRLLVALERSTLRPVANQLRRLQVQIRWREAGVDKETRPIGFFVAR